jgi:hypothetical protein
LDILAESATLIDPEPIGETMLVTARVKVNTRFVWRGNDAGVPIMHIYPKDNAPVSERVQIIKGKPILVYKKTVTADGGGVFLCMAGSLKKYGKTLYVRKQDTKKAG